uniref:Iron/manganese ABC transporter permease subunit YfeD n=1 Tax=Candidatus Aschnera chinzeii TaxID=1485666 RepID=A0AAT9G4P6_9ENTR|nr:MAG: iron/manganese ABC transporter permease subunit YfeD [Candidatus Aschnera chinzeii]
MIDNILYIIKIPFIFPFMQKAIIIAVVIGTVCAILSCFLILKGWSLMGDAISHAVLPGIVITFMCGIELSIGAFLSGIFCTIATGFLKEHSRIKEDTIMGIVFSGMFAIGLILFAYVDTNQHLLHIMFGNMLGISNTTFINVICTAIFIILIILIKRKDFLLYCFDINHAKIINLPVKIIHYGLLMLLSLSIVISLQVVGLILVIAMLITPGIVAFVLCKNFNHMLIVAVISSVSSSVIGTIISFHIDASTGPCIVLIQSCYFIFALIYNYVKNKILI